MDGQQNLNTLGVVLAGGQSRRMGVADKCLLSFSGRPLLEHVINKAKPQVAELVLSANGDPARFAAYEIPVVADIPPERCGPLAGIISAMVYASKVQWQPQWLATFPSDAPLAPEHWVEELQQAAARSLLDVAVAADRARPHYTFALWACRRLPQLQQIFNSGERALHKVVEQLYSEVVVCCESATAFTNLNTQEELMQLEASCRSES